MNNLGSDGDKVIEHTHAQPKGEQKRRAGVEGQFEPKHIHHLGRRETIMRSIMSYRMHHARWDHSAWHNAPSKWPLTFAPQKSEGGSGSGVTTVTWSPASLSPLIRHSKRFFIPETWEKGEGSTKMATLFVLATAEFFGDCRLDSSEEGTPSTRPILRKGNGPKARPSFIQEPREDFAMTGLPCLPACMIRKKWIKN